MELGIPTIQLHLKAYYCFLSNVPGSNPSEVHIFYCVKVAENKYKTNIKCLIENRIGGVLILAHRTYDNALNKSKNEKYAKSLSER